MLIRTMVLYIRIGYDIFLRHTIAFTYCLWIQDILPKRNSSERHFVENDISSKFHLKLSKILSKNKKRRYWWEIYNDMTHCLYFSMELTLVGPFSSWDCNRCFSETPCLFSTSPSMVKSINTTFSPFLSIPTDRQSNVHKTSSGYFRKMPFILSLDSSIRKI